jgi:hypothetical protein
VEDAYERAKEILSQHWDKVNEVVEALLEHETLDREQFRAIMGDEYRPNAIDQEEDTAAVQEHPEQPESVAAVRTEEQGGARRSESAFEGKQPKPAVN